MGMCFHHHHDQQQKKKKKKIKIKCQNKASNKHVNMDNPI